MLRGRSSSLRDRIPSLRRSLHDRRVIKQPRLFRGRMLVHRRRRRTYIQRHLTTTITALSHLIAQNALVARLLVLPDYVLENEQRRP